MCVKQKDCEICHKELSKYVCPRCKMNTCSLPCFKQHKTEKSCSGKSDATLGTRDSFIGKKDLDNNDIQRDYNFLLKMNRSLELTKRSKNESKIMKLAHRKYNNGNMNKNQNQNQKWVLQHGVRVMKVPFGMERGKINKSGGKANNWSWTIEWILINGENEVLNKYIKFKSIESSVLKSLIPKDWITGNETYSILFKSMETNKFIKIDEESKLCDILRGELIIEFPTFYITKDNLSKFNIEEIEPNSEEESESSSESSSDSTSDSDSNSESDSDGPPEEESSKDPTFKQTI